MVDQKGTAMQISSVSVATPRTAERQPAPVKTEAAETGPDRDHDGDEGAAKTATKPVEAKSSDPNRGQAVDIKA